MMKNNYKFIVLLSYICIMITYIYTHIHIQISIYIQWVSLIKVNKIYI
jgi:hypothetical protein